MLTKALFRARPLCRQASTFIQVGDDFDIDSIKLQRTNEALMVQQPWTQRPFVSGQEL